MKIQQIRERLIKIGPGVYKNTANIINIEILKHFFQGSRKVKMSLLTVPTQYCTKYSMKHSRAREKRKG
jgi:hypothetical protein